MELPTMKQKIPNLTIVAGYLKREIVGALDKAGIPVLSAEEDGTIRFAAAGVDVDAPGFTLVTFDPETTRDLGYEWELIDPDGLTGIATFKSFREVLSWAQDDNNQEAS